MIQRELTLFVVVGVATVLVDLASYRVLASVVFIDVNTAKGLSFICGIIFSYFANKTWTFGHKSHRAGTLWRHVMLYTNTLWINVLVNSLVLSAGYEIENLVLVAFLVATSVSTVLNFIGMRYFVFRSL